MSNLNLKVLFSPSFGLFVHNEIVFHRKWFACVPCVTLCDHLCLFVLFVRVCGNMYYCIHTKFLYIIGLICISIGSLPSACVVTRLKLTPFVE